MKLKNIPWIIAGAVIIVIGMFYDKVLNLPPKGSRIWGGH